MPSTEAPTWFILRHGPTGGYMPELSKLKSGGYTHTEPASYPHKPRLFHTAASARVALSWWLKGTTRADDKPDYYGEADGGLYTTPPPPDRPRRREDWDIVPVMVMTAGPALPP